MRRLLAAAAAATTLAGLAVAVGVASAEPSDPASQDVAVARAEHLLDVNRAAVNGSADDGYSVFRVIVDKDGSSHVRYDRTYKGLPVLGGDFVIHTGPAVPRRAGRAAGAASTSAGRGSGERWPGVGPNPGRQ